MDYGRPDTRDRITSAVGVAALHAVLGYALITGLGVDVRRGIDNTLKVFDVPVEPPRPPLVEAVSAKTQSKPAPRAPAPPNLKATPSPVVAPAPIVRLKTPVVVAASVPSVGSAPEAGASDRPGPGTGAGGEGSGTGGGGSDDGYGAGGAGDGDGGEIVARARRIGGRISESDLPRALKRAGAEGTVLTRYSIGPDGRVSDCEVTRSSGYPDLDSHTCRLVRYRFRYRPARDAAGRPVTDVLFGEHHWWAGR